MLRSSAWVFIAKLLVAVLNFGTVIVLSRWLGPADRGICGWYVVIITISLVFSDMIAGPASGYLLQNYSSKAIRQVSYCWSVLISVATTAILFFLKKITIQEAATLTVLCWLNSANSLHIHLLLARQKLRLFNLFTLLSPLLTLFFITLFMLLARSDRYFYLVSLLLSWTICFLFGIFLLGEKISGKENINRLIAKGFRNGMANQASHIASILNNRLIYFLIPSTLLGVYANALSLAEASLMIPSSFGQVLYAASLNNKKPGNLLETTLGSLVTSMLLLLLVFLFVLIIPGEFYVFLFGNGFSGVKSYLGKLSLFMIFYGGYLICSYRQSSNGRFINNFYANLAGVFVNCGLSVIFYFQGNYTIKNSIIALGSGFIAMFLASLALSGKVLAGTGENG